MISENSAVMDWAIFGRQNMATVMLDVLTTIVINAIFVTTLFIHNWLFYYVFVP